MQNLKLLVLLTFTILLFYSCNKVPTCETPLNVNQSSLEVIFKDKASGNYLYSETNSLFNKDSLIVSNQLGNPLYLLYSLREIPNTSNRFQRINFGSLYNSQTDEYSFNIEICKKFFIRYSFNKFDTIETCFKSKKTTCGSVFEILKIYNKGTLISTEYDQTDSQITIFKN